MAFLGSCTLLKLNRSGWLTCDVIHDPVHMADFVDDTTRDLLQNLPGDLCGLCRHKVDRVDGAQRDRVV